MIGKASKFDSIPHVDSPEELISFLEGKRMNNKKNLSTISREESSHKLLELCVATESTTFLYKVKVKNILKAAQELYDRF